MHIAFVVTSLLLPIAVGLGILYAEHAPTSRILVQILACVFVLVLGFAWRFARGFARGFVSRVPSLIPTLVLILIATASTLLYTGLDGVQRWWEWGPVRLHASACLAPAFLLLAARAPILHFLGWTLLLQIIHTMQPDAGQALAVFLPVFIAVFTSGDKHGYKQSWGVWGLLLAHILALGYTVSRRDTLEAAPFVEDLWRRLESYPVAVWGIVALSALLWMAAPVIRLLFYTYHPTHPSCPHPEENRGGMLLSLYFAGTLIASCWGCYPIPMFGAAPASIIGAGVGWMVLLKTYHSRFSTQH